MPFGRVTCALHSSWISLRVPFLLQRRHLVAKWRPCSLNESPSTPLSLYHFRSLPKPRTSAVWQTVVRSRWLVHRHGPPSLVFGQWLPHFSFYLLNRERFIKCLDCVQGKERLTCGSCSFALRASIFEFLKVSDDVFFRIGMTLQRLLGCGGELYLYLYQSFVTSGHKVTLDDALSDENLYYYYYILWWQQLPWFSQEVVSAALEFL